MEVMQVLEMEQEYLVVHHLLLVVVELMLLLLEVTQDKVDQVHHILVEIQVMDFWRRIYRPRCWRRRCWCFC